MRSPRWPLIVFGIPVLVGGAYGIVSLFLDHLPESTQVSMSNRASNLSSDVSDKKLEHSESQSSVPVVLDSKDQGAHTAESAKPLVDLDLSPIGIPSQSGYCMSFEYSGTGPLARAPSDVEWAHVLDAFHDLKKHLIVWADQHHLQIADSTYQWMKGRMQSIKLHRPPTAAEPDLAFRGIGALTRDDQGEPVIRLGVGFPKLLKTDAPRARFELARLLAQSWAPCELVRNGVESPWTSLLHCLDKEAKPECSNPASSDSSWAVSSVVALQVADPGCRLEALREPVKMACSNAIPFPAEMTKTAEHSSESEPSAKREPAEAQVPSALQSPTQMSKPISKQMPKQMTVKVLLTPTEAPGDAHE